MVSPIKPTVFHRLCLILGAIAIALVAVANPFATPKAFAASMTSASGNGDPQAFTVTATSSNTYGYIMYINNSLTNNQPNLNVQATQVWPNNYDAHSFGVWYSSYSNEWTVFNEDIAAIPLGTSFNLSVHLNGNPYYLFTATASNSSGDSAYINNSLVNGQPNAAIFVTQDWTGTYDTHNIGVWYNGSNQEWAVFNEDGTAIPAGSSFFIVLEDFQSNYYAYTQVATTSNTNSYITYINDPAINNQPNLYPQVTQVWDTQDRCGCVFNNHTIGVWYSSYYREWAVYNVDIAAIPVGAEFFVDAI